MLSRNPGIRLKITLAFSLVFAFLSIALNLYCYHRIRQLIIGDNDLYLLSRARSLLDKTEVNPVIIPLPDKNAAMRVFVRQRDGSNTILFESPGEIHRIPVPAGQGVRDIGNLRVAYVASDNPENPAELMLVVSGDALRTTLQYLLFLLLLSTLLSVLVSGVISYWMAGLLLRPVQRIIATTRNINAGQLRERVPVNQSNDELQELAETINQMLSRIDAGLQQQQNFFASASHELKTPLAVMRTEIEVNLKKPTVSEDFRELLSSQLQEINRLQNVVHEFLIISQIKADKLLLNSEWFDLSELCLRVFRQLKPLASVRNMEFNLVFNHNTDDFSLCADREKIRLVLINLLENAIKYGKESGLVTCFVGKISDGQHMNIRIENQTEQRVMGTVNLTLPFHRESALQAGAGIGLWLCQEILAAHQAAFVLSSRDYCFSAAITFPMAYAPETQAE